MWDSAFSKYVTASQGSGAGGDTTLTVTVPTGEVWEVIHGMAYHNDGAGARSTLWYAQTGGLGMAKSIAADIPLYLYGGWDGAAIVPNPFCGPLRLYGGQTIAVICSGMAAGATLTGRLWVRFLRGVNRSV